MQEFVEFTLGGISDGVIYAAIGLSLVLIWRGTRVLNYAQGGMAMFTSYLALFVINVDRQLLARLRCGACRRPGPRRGLERAVSGRRWASRR